MRQVFRERMTVQAGGIVEIHEPALLEGRNVEVIVLIDEPDDQATASPAPLSRYVGESAGDHVTEKAARFYAAHGNA